MSSSFLRKFPREYAFVHTVRSFSTPSHPASQRRWSSSVTLSAVALSSIVVGTICPPTPLSTFFPRISPGPCAESLDCIVNLENKLQTLPALIALRNRKDADGWYETRPYQHYPEERRVNNLTAGALRGPGKLALLPLIRVKNLEGRIREPCLSPLGSGFVLP